MTQSHYDHFHLDGQDAALLVMDLIGLSVTSFTLTRQSSYYPFMSFKQSIHHERDGNKSLLMVLLYLHLLTSRKVRAPTLKEMATAPLLAMTWPMPVASLAVTTSVMALCNRTGDVGTIKLSMT